MEYIQALQNNLPYLVNIVLFILAIVFIFRVVLPRFGEDWSYKNTFYLIFLGICIYIDVVCSIVYFN